MYLVQSMAEHATAPTMLQQQSTYPHTVRSAEPPVLEDRTRSTGTVANLDSRYRIAALFKDLPRISLDETNRLAQMLSRTDRKYIVGLDPLRALMKRIQNEYAVLEINGLRQFSYASCYYDDEFGCYFEHHQKRRQRFKVRTRHYVDSGKKYFEIKLKGLRGSTQKYRTDCNFLVTPRVEGR